MPQALVVVVQLLLVILPPKKEQASPIPGQNIAGFKEFACPSQL
jgi:hypothetical protein